VEKVNLLDLEWDNLIILDACRYDVFEKLNFIRGNLRKIESVGVHTLAWVQNTFRGRDCRDIVYYCANPVVKTELLKIEKSPQQIYETWKWGWNNRFSTVIPEAVNAAVVCSQSLHKGKRKIIHYLHPHAPYISRPDLGGQPLTDIEKGKRSPEIVNECKVAYKENVVFVLEAVEKLLPYLEGKVIVSSDHGEAFGEEGKFGHSGCKLSCIVEVPLLEINLSFYKSSDGEKEIRERKKRLQALGYA